MMKSTIAPGARPAVSTETHVRQVFALTQGKPPMPKFLIEKIGRPAAETLEKSLKSKYFAETVLDEFLRGAEDPDRYSTLALSEAVVAAEAARFGGANVPPVGPVDASGSAGGRAVPLAWREALLTFWEGIGETGQRTLLKWVAQSSEKGRRNGTDFASAAQLLRRIDRMVAAEETVEAFLEARRRVEAGLTCFATRYLAIGYRLCMDPVPLARLVQIYSPSCSRRFSDALRAGLGGMVLSAGTHRAAALRIEGELPDDYAERTDSAPGPAPAEAAALWAALIRPSLAPTPRQARGAPGVVMAASGAPAAEIAAGALALAAAGISVTLIDPPGGETRQLIVSQDPVVVAADFAEAHSMDRREGQGPLLILGRYASIPPALFEILAQFGPDDAILPVCFEIGSVAVPAGSTGLAGRVSVPAGIVARDAATGWALLEESRYRPDLAVVDLGDGPSPVSLFLDYDGAAEPAASVKHAALIVVFGPGAEHAGSEIPADATMLRLQGDISGSMAAEALAERARAQNLTDDAPVVFLSAGIAYAENYVRGLIRRYEIYARRLPVAVRGLEIRRKDGTCALASAKSEAGLYRAAPLGLTCLGLEAALKALRQVGLDPASGGTVVFDPAAAAWNGGSGLVRGPWSGILRRIDADVETAQRIFDQGRVDLFAAISRRELASDVPAAIPFQTYLRRHEAVRRHMSDALRAIDPAPALDELLRTGAVAGLLDDGEGTAVQGFLEALAPRITRFASSLPTASFRTLIDLVVQCGVQDLYAAELAALAPRLCSENPFAIFPVFQIVSSVLDDTVVLAALTAALARETAMKRPRTRHLLRLCTLAGDLCPDAMLPFVLKLIDADLGANLSSHPDILRVFGRRISSLSHLPESDFRLERSGLARSDFLAAVLAKDRLSAALVAGDRADAIVAMREIADREGQVRSLIELLRGMTGEAARLGITSRDWYYPAYCGLEETLAMATILGDAEAIESRLDQSGASVLGAVARLATGDRRAFEDLYAGWAASEGLRPMRFEGNDVAALFAGFVEQGGAPTSPAGADAGMPLVSTIVTTFDADPEMLRLSLRSILRQSWPAFEILLVDDGSTAALRAEAWDVAGEDPRIRCFEQPRNMGPYVARNRALAEARGDFVAIQDADDVSHPERFARQVALLQSHPDAYATASGHVRFDENAKLQFQTGLEVVADGTMSTMFRRSVFDRLGPFCKTRSRGDVEYRERIRQAFGPAAFRETVCPLVFCFGAPTTLSQTVAREKAYALKEFRNGFGQRRWQHAPSGPVPLGRLPIPMALRP